MQVESTLLFETPEEIFRRVFRTVKPRTAIPEVRLRFREFANANSAIRLEEGRLEVKITDILEGAPAPVIESLAYILISKLYRKPIPPIHSHRYRLYFNRRDVRHNLHLVRQARGRKQMTEAEGNYYNLQEIFEELNFKYFHGLMARPELGWSQRPSRTTLGHYDPSHNTIILSSVLDHQKVPRIAVEYVMFHEMLHLRHPAEHRGSRRCVHTPEFKAAEKQFEDLQRARKVLREI